MDVKRKVDSSESFRFASPTDPYIAKKRPEVAKLDKLELEVLGNNVLDGAERDFNEGVDERVERFVRTQFTQHSRPQTQRVDVLPVVHELDALLDTTQTHNKHHASRIESIKVNGFAPA